MSENDITKEITKEVTGWNQAVVMICSKCGEEGLRIKDELKPICKERQGKNVRVINTGCLNICPENKMAITVADNDSREVFRSYSVPTDVDAEDLYNELF